MGIMTTFIWLVCRHRQPCTFISVFDGISCAGCFRFPDQGHQVYDLGMSGVVRGEASFLVRRPNNPYDVNCIDVRPMRGRVIVGHLEAPVAAHLSRLMLDLQYQ